MKRRELINKIMDWAAKEHLGWLTQSQKPEHTLEKDYMRTNKVLKTIYQDASLKDFEGCMLLSLTTKTGNLVYLGNDGWLYTRGGEEHCLGEEENQFAYAMRDCKTTSDYIAHLSAFINTNV